MTLAGATRLLNALAKLEDDLNDGSVAKVAGELVLRTAKARSHSRRVRRVGKVSVRGNKAVIKFGGAKAPPFTAASHFGHGSASRPRAQGGWMPRNPFLFDARDEHEEDIVDLYLTQTGDSIRRLF